MHLLWFHLIQPIFDEIGSIFHLIILSNNLAFLFSDTRLALSDANSIT